MKRILKYFFLIFTPIILICACAKEEPTSTTIETSPIIATTEPLLDLYSPELYRFGRWGLLMQTECSISGDEVFSKTIEDGCTITINPALITLAPAQHDMYCKGTILGTPEIDLEFSVKISEIQEYYLSKGSYTDYTELVNIGGEYGYYNSFEIDDFFPIRWDIFVICQDETELHLSASGSSADSETGFSLLDPSTEEKLSARIDNFLSLLERHNPGLVHTSLHFSPQTGDIELRGKLCSGVKTNFSLIVQYEWPLHTTETTLTSDYEKATTLLGNLASGVVSPEQAGCADANNFGSALHATVSFAVHPR